MIVDPLYLFAVGFMMGLVIDVIWWAKGFDKYDKAMEWHEHYHVGLELGIIGMIFNLPILTGLMVAFVLAEWSQDHKFAIGSGHFKISFYVGLILFILYLLELFYKTL